MNVEMETEVTVLGEKEEIVEVSEEIEIEVRVQGKFDNQLRTYTKNGRNSVYPIVSPITSPI
jgi:hypothetical protein